MKFETGPRPKRSFTHRGVKRAPHIQAILDTFENKKAVVFSTIAEAKRAYVGAYAVCRRRYPDRKVVIQHRTVWVGPRSR